MGWEAGPNTQPPVTKRPLYGFPSLAAVPGIVTDRRGLWTLDTTPDAGDDGFIPTIERWAALGGSEVNRKEMPWQIGQVFGPNVDCGWVGSGLMGAPTLRSPKDFAAFARAGWPLAAAAMRGLCDATPAPLERSWKRRRFFADDGEELDVERLRETEDPERSYRAQRRDPDGARMGGVTIAVNHSAAAATAPEMVASRGYVALALAESLERAGMPTRVVAFDQAPDGYRWQDTEMVTVGEYIQVVAKGYGEEIDLSRMAIAVAHPAVLRLAFFAGMLAAPLPVNDGFGSALGGLPLVTDGSGTIVIDTVLDEQHARAVLSVFCEEINAGNLSPERPLVAGDHRARIAKAYVALGGNKPSIAYME